MGIIIRIICHLEQAEIHPAFEGQIGISDFQCKPNYRMYVFLL